MPFHVQPCWSLEYLTRWSVMFSVALIGSTTVEGAFSFGGVCSSAGRLAVGLVRHRKCAERGIAGSHDLDARRARRRLHLVDHFPAAHASSVLISFQDMVPVLRNLVTFMPSASSCLEMRLYPCGTDHTRRSVRP
jgi:hypothetical protein